MPNLWMSHVAAFWKKHKGKMSYKQALQEAKKTYKKTAAPKKAKAKKKRSVKK